VRHLIAMQALEAALAVLDGVTQSRKRRHGHTWSDTLGNRKKSAMCVYSTLHRPVFVVTRTACLEERVCAVLDAQAHSTPSREDGDAEGARSRRAAAGTRRRVCACRGRRPAKGQGEGAMAWRAMRTPSSHARAPLRAAPGAARRVACFERCSAAPAAAAAAGDARVRARPACLSVCLAAHQQTHRPTHTHTHTHAIATCPTGLQEGLV
jgi:hypothetical protein